MKPIILLPVLAMLPAAALAADAPPKDLRFPKGAISVTMVGKVGAGEVRYRFSGRRDQRLRVTISSPGRAVVVDVSGDGKVIPMGASDDNGRVDAPLPYTGPFIIAVRRESGRAVTSYTLKVTITG